MAPKAQQQLRHHGTQGHCNIPGGVLQPYGVVLEACSHPCVWLYRGPIYYRSSLHLRLGSLEVSPDSKSEFTAAMWRVAEAAASLQTLHEAAGQPQASYNVPSSLHSMIVAVSQGPFPGTLPLRGNGPYLVPLVGHNSPVWELLTHIVFYIHLTELNVQYLPHYTWGFCSKNPHG